MVIEKVFINIEMKVPQKSFYFMQALVRALACLETFEGNEVLNCNIQTCGVEDDE